MPDKSSASVIAVLKQYATDHRLADTFEYLDIEWLRADAGSQFTAEEFAEYCRAQRINLTLAAPKKQNQNHLAERTWQTVHNTARSLLVHSRLPDTFAYHAIMYSTAIFNVLPVTGLTRADGNIATPHEMFLNLKPLLQDFRVFGCPVVCKKWTSEGGHENKQTERGMRGIFIGFSPQQKGFLIYTPGSRHIVISGDVIFDESFSTVTAATWQQHHDSLALHPLRELVTDPDTVGHCGRYGRSSRRGGK
jgi:hypothetical protein